MKSHLGMTVLLHLTVDQQLKLGGNHNPQQGNIKIAPAIVCGDFTEEKQETDLLNLHVIGDCRDTIWATSCPKGTEPGQWQYIKDAAPEKVDKKKLSKEPGRVEMKGDE